MIIKTTDGYHLDTDNVTKIEFLEETPLAPHWGYWVCWLLIFWPVLAILMFMTFTNKAYLCKINDLQIVKLRKEDYNTLVSKVNSKTPSVSS